MEDEEARLKREQEERLKREQEERLKREQEERLKREQENRILREEVERLRKEEEELIKYEEEDRILKEEVERLRGEEEERILKEKREQLLLRIEEEKLFLKEEKEQLEHEEEYRILKKEEERLRSEEKEFLRKEEAEYLRKIKEEHDLRAKREVAESVKPKEVGPSEPRGSTPESENLLLRGLVNLIQPALDIKMESKRYQRWIKGWDKAVQVHILNEGYIHVIIKDNHMRAAIGKAPREPDVVMEGEYKTITNYLNGELDPILMFFDLILLRKMRLVKGLEIKLSNILSGNIVQQARDLYRIDRLLKIK